MQKTVLALATLALLTAAFGPTPPAAFAMGNRIEATPEPGDKDPAATIPDMEEAAGHLIHLGARLTFETAKGPFTIVTFPREAPKTVAQIVKLVKAGFYDGLAAHRVVPGVAVQVGDPLTKTMAASDPKVGRGGSGFSVPPEFQGQTVRHLAGSVGLARGKDPASGDSQFFVTLKEAPHLDEAYTVFGLVTKGMDVVRQLAVGDRIVRAIVAQEDPAAPKPSASPNPSLPPKP